MLLRTFICIEIPQAQRGALGRWLADRRRDTPDVRWVCPETLHITLKFCGEIPQTMVEDMMRHLATMKQKGPLELGIQGIGGFPNLRAPRAIWCGVTGDLKRLKELHYDVETAALRVGLDREVRPYNAHITLGRRDTKGSLSDAQRSALEQDPFRTEMWSAETVTLMKSELFPQGPKYTPLGVFKI